MNDKEIVAMVIYGVIAVFTCWTIIIPIICIRKISKILAQA